MISNAVRDELRDRLLAILADQKAGRVDTRKELADMLADECRKLMSEKYSPTAEKKPTGIVQTRDVVQREDFKQ